MPQAVFGKAVKGLTDLLNYMRQRLGVIREQSQLGQRAAGDLLADFEGTVLPPPYSHRFRNVVYGQ
jgi:hypothetical protein